MRPFMQRYLAENPFGLKRLLWDSDRQWTPSSAFLIAIMLIMLLTVALIPVLVTFVINQCYQPCSECLDVLLDALQLPSHLNNFGFNYAYLMGLVAGAFVVVQLAHWLGSHSTLKLANVGRFVQELTHLVGSNYRYMARLVLLVILVGFLFPMPKVVFTVSHQQPQRSTIYDSVIDKLAQVEIHLDKEPAVRSEFALTSNLSNEQIGQGHGSKKIISLLGGRSLYEMIYLFSVQLVEQPAEGGRTLIKYITFGEKFLMLVRYLRSSNWVVTSEVCLLLAATILEVISYITFYFLFEPFTHLLWYLIKTIAFDAQRVSKAYE